MENKVETVITRAEVEDFFSKQLTDKQWEIVASSIEDTILYRVWDELPSTIQDLDYLVEQDSKFD
jgi:hypothetical protein